MLVYTSVTLFSESMESIFKKDKTGLISLAIWTPLTAFWMFYYIFPHRWEPCLLLVTNAWSWIKYKLLSHTQMPGVRWAQLAPFPDANVYLHLAAVKRWDWGRTLEELQKWTIYCSRKPKGPQKYKESCFIRKN